MYKYILSYFISWVFIRHTDQWPIVFSKFGTFIINDLPMIIVLLKQFWWLVNKYVFFFLIRFGIGRFTTVEEIDYTANHVIEQVNKLRELSPLWEMEEEGIDLSKIEWTQH